MTLSLRRSLFAICSCLPFLFLPAIAQSLVDYTKGYVVKKVVGQDEGINSPVDLDFVPQSEKENELWIVNREGPQGGSVVIVYSAGLSNQSSEYRKDSFSGHFMAHSTGIAMGDNGNFGTSQEFQPDGRGGFRLFMGPSLWSHDTSIFARKNQNNEEGLLGSHLDMLHESPIGMGIAHDSANVYWYWDGYHENLVRYDFQVPHEIGGHDHSDGIIWRFSEVELKRIAELPSHLILNKATKHLYICDPANQQIVIVNTQSRQRQAPLPVYQEVVSDYSDWSVPSGLTRFDVNVERPSSIEVFGNRLLVGDYTTGDIAIYNIDNPTAPTEEMIVRTGKPGLSGIVVGPDSQIWFTNFLEKEVSKIDVQTPSTVTEQGGPTFSISPNPASGYTTVETSHAGVITIVSELGELVKEFRVDTGTRSLDISGLSSGRYLVVLTGVQGVSTRALVIY